MAVTFPVRVPDGDGVRVLNTDQDLLDYQRELYVRSHQNPALRGEPVPNYTMQQIPEDLRDL